MTKRIVIKAFTFNQPDGEKRQFAFGEKVDGDLAEHWYVQAHSEPEDEASNTAPSLSTSSSIATGGESSLSTAVAE